MEEEPGGGREASKQPAHSVLWPGAESRPVHVSSAQAQSPELLCTHGPAPHSQHRKAEQPGEDWPAVAPSAHLTQSPQQRSLPEPLRPLPRTPPAQEGGEAGCRARRGHSRRPVFLSTSQAGLSRRVLLTRNVVTAWKRNVPTVLRFYHKRMHVLLTLKILPVSISGYLAKRRPPFSAQHCDYKGCGLSGDFQIYSPQPTRNTLSWDLAHAHTHTHSTLIVLF